MATRLETVTLSYWRAAKTMRAPDADRDAACSAFAMLRDLALCRETPPAVAACAAQDLQDLGHAGVITVHGPANVDPPPDAPQGAA